MHLGCCSTFGKRKNTLAFEYFYAFQSLATSLVHGSHNPARKTIRYSFIKYAGIPIIVVSWRTSRPAFHIYTGAFKGYTCHFVMYRVPPSHPHVPF
jgi:hypothetical protein